MLKVVLDTNLIVSALITPNGQPAQILKAWHENLFELVISPQIIEEMSRVLSLEKIKKFTLLSDKEIDGLLSAFGKTLPEIPKKFLLPVHRLKPLYR